MIFLQASSFAVAKDMGSFSHTSRDRWGAAFVGMAGRLPNDLSR